MMPCQSAPFLDTGAFSPRTVWDESYRELGACVNLDPLKKQTASSYRRTKPFDHPYVTLGVQQRSYPLLPSHITFIYVEDKYFVHSVLIRPQVSESVTLNLPIVERNTTPSIEDVPPNHPLSPIAAHKILGVPQYPIHSENLPTTPSAFLFLSTCSQT